MGKSDRPSSRSATLEIEVQRLSAAMKDLEAKITSHQAAGSASSQLTEQALKLLERRLDEIAYDDESIPSEIGNSGGGTKFSSSPECPADAFPSRVLRFVLPRFEGNDVLDWINKANQFFSFYNIGGEQRIQMAIFHMVGEASTWIQLMKRYHQFDSWDSLTEAMEIRFGTSDFSEAIVALTNLVQRGTVKEYIAEFERLAFRSRFLPEKFILHKFTAGLKNEIMCKVLLVEPTTFFQAVALAKVYEIEGKPSKTPAVVVANSQAQSSCAIKNGQESAKPPGEAKKMTGEETRARSDKMVSFSCDERSVLGNYWKKGETDEETDSGSEEEEEEGSSAEFEKESGETLEPKVTISHQFLDGKLSPRMFRAKGSIKGRAVQVIVDAGSTHNFVRDSLACQFRLKFSRSPDLDVTVDDGKVLRCSGKCDGVKLSIQGCDFKVDLCMLPISGADVVLGVQWLEQMENNIMVNYKELNMIISYQGRKLLFEK